MTARLNIRRFRRQLASIESVPQFAVMGLLAGTLTGLLIVAFRFAVEVPLGLLLGDAENFESLPFAWLFIVPVTGSIVLAIGLSLIALPDRRVGVVHVLERLARHQGYLPLKNAVTQFVAGTIALASGASGGREGPAIHLGAACSSLLGQSMKLPNNSIRVLVGCGAAAAISASFNTPIAGVIFSMEVIILEYTVTGFIPVILAAVAAALVLRLFYGTETAFLVPDISMQSFIDLPFMIALGLIIGSVAALYSVMVQLIFARAPASVALRMMIAGIVTGALALASPSILGVGYDSVNAALNGDMIFNILLMLLVCKLIASSVTVAMGVPVGLIGPTLVIGASAGGLLWFIATLVSDQVSPPAFYVMLGMGAMMGAVLQAPLAALMAVMELTHNPSIILPAMLAIVIASITSKEAFRQNSLFITQMEMMGLEFRQNPLSLALSRSSVASIMTRSFERVPGVISAADARATCRRNPTWLLVDNADRKPTYILRAEDLVLHIDSEKPEDDADIDLSSIPATRKDVTDILLQATLLEAMDRLNQRGVQAVYVNRITAPLMDSPVGILTRDDIERYYNT